MNTKIIYINGLSQLLGVSPAAIHAHLRRHNYGAVPHPIRIGNKYAWITDDVDHWLAEKKLFSEQKKNESIDQYSNHQKTRGRPRKIDMVKARRKMET